MISEGLRKSIEATLSGTHHRPVSVEHISPVGGGCINETAKIETTAGNFFCKWNDAKKYPGMFEAEAKGLTLLAGANSIYIPQVICTGKYDATSFIILEFVEPADRRNDFFVDFGISLARLHKNSNKQFGLDHDNYIGSLPQCNKQHERWPDFFIEERLIPQMRMAGITGARAKRFENLFNRLDNIFPSEEPALLHGDLWGGNYIASLHGTACLIDPAVYYGHREMDLGMSKLFGGFDNEFYESYHREFPLEPGWASRLDICNLYPLLVHVNLFGGSYIYQVDAIITKF